MRILSTIAVLVLVSSAPALAASAAETIPAGEAPKIDGVLSEEEWEGARRVDLAPEGVAYLLRDDDAIHVGVRVGRNCIPSLTLHVGNRVLVLHASASLGTAVYEQKDGSWTATRTFAWRCRDGRTSDEDRRRFFEEEKWFATTCEVGRRGESEYRISKELLGDGETRLALVVCRLMPGPVTACAWPETVRDGSRDQDLLFGRCPTLKLDPSTWARLDLGATKPPTTEEKAREAAAKRDLERVLEWLGDKEDRIPRSASLRREAERRLRQVETRHPGTKAAKAAKERREAIAAN